MEWGSLTRIFQDRKNDMNVCYRVFRVKVNPLTAELSAHCNVQKTGD
jgi:hypothetical protein